MSPSGISVFYGTLEEDTAIAEVQPSIMDSVATGQFEVKNHLNVIDLSRLPSPKSIFNKNYDFHFEEVVLPFLQQFTKDISKPIRASDTTIEYVPTQVFTELIRNASSYRKLPDTFVSFEVNGLVYPSSLKNDGTCIVLFRGADISCLTQDIKEDAWLIFKSTQLAQVNKICLNYVIFAAIRRMQYLI